MVHRRFPLGNVLVATTVIARAFPGLRTAFAAEADSTIDLKPLREKKSVLVSTKDGRWIEGKPIGVPGDSLILKKGKSLFRMDAGDIAGAWTKRPAPLRGALVFGLGGIVGGALVELGLQSECPTCTGNAGDVLGTAALTGAIGGAAGAFGGCLAAVGSNWLLLPRTARGRSRFRPGAPPVHGAAFDLDLRLADEQFGPGIRHAPRRGVPSQRRLVLLQRDVPERRRLSLGLSHGAGPLAGRFVERDSVRTLVYEATRESRESTFGINLGTGVYFGRGSFHPGVDARVHWVLSPQQFWYTLGLKADWH